MKRADTGLPRHTPAGEKGLDGNGFSGRAHLCDRRRIQIGRQLGLQVDRRAPRIGCLVGLQAARTGQHQLSDQLYRSFGSIRANITEEYSRSSRKDQPRTYEYSLGSAREPKSVSVKNSYRNPRVNPQTRDSNLRNPLTQLCTMRHATRITIPPNLTFYVSSAYYSSR